MLLSSRESELFNIAVNMAVSLDNNNPEVGMGPSRQTLARKVAKMLTYEVDEQDIEIIC